jgi:methylase of polypeptide subunit release factors
MVLRGVVKVMQERKRAAHRGAGEAGDGEGDKIHVVDFASATGIFSLPLAALLPDCIFTLVDMNDEAIELAAETAADAGLTNVRTHCCAIQDHRDRFDIALGMHACGTPCLHSHRPNVLRRV